MVANDKYVGLFWVVYEQIYGPKIVFDDPKVINDGRYLRLDTSFEESWPIFKDSNNLPNKPFDHYPHGEVVFDTKTCKFTVFGTPKLVHSVSMQKKIINWFKLPKFVVFEQYGDDK